MVAVYGQTIYNQDTYTADGTRTTIGWDIQFDWDNDGVFDGNEADRTVDFYSRRGRQFFVHPRGEGIAQMRPGRCVVVLDNNDGRFDPFNTSSPIYGDILPGRFGRVKVDYNATKTFVFSGKIIDISPVIMGDNQKYCRITMEDGIRLLNDQKISETVQINQTGATLAAAILSESNWPSIWGSNVSGMGLSMPYWWAERKSAFDLLHDFGYFQWGIVYVAADGSLSYKDYPNFIVGYGDQQFDESEIGKDIQIIQPWEIMKNYFSIYFHPIVEQSAVEIWRFNDMTKQVDAAETIYIWADFSYDGKPVSADNLITPVATTDYTANDTQGGGGTDRTSDMSVSIAATFGQSAKLAITNNGATAFYITLLKQRGDAYTRPNTGRYEVDNVAASPLDDRLDFSVNYEFITNYDKAKLTATQWKTLVGANKKIPAFSVDTLPGKQFVDVADHIQVKSSTLGLDQVIGHGEIIGLDYRVGFVEHRWGDENGQIVLTNIICEPFASLYNVRS